MDDSKFLILGSKGQLGSELIHKYPSARNADSSELDITDFETMNQFNWDGIEVILNAAAYTNVDGAETSDGRIAAWNVNAKGVANLVRIASEKSLTLVHISSEYVFDGTKNPHLETEPLSPLGVYGQSKAAGDVAVGILPKHYIIRTSWVIGEGNNFVRTMVSLGQKGVEPSVVNDQVGRLSFTSELVRGIDHLLSIKAEYGIYNLSNGGDPTSWAEVTREIYKLAGFNLKVSDITTAEYFADKKEASPRPLNSTLSLDKIQSTGFSSNDWREELKIYIDKELNK